MTRIDRDTVVAALRAEDVAQHYGIKGVWRGRWMRSRQCGATDHPTDAMGISRDGRWHCHACDDGGDLLKLIAIAERVDVRNDFSRVLELAAGIAGIVPDDDFGGGKPTPPPRAPVAPEIPIGVRLQLARRRAEWVWSKLFTTSGSVIATYLGERGILEPGDVLSREELRMTPAKIPSDLIAKSEDLRRLAHMFGPPGVAVPVRSPIDGAMVDIRVRRIDPAPDKPKIVGMLGGVVRERDELHGCYGRPHDPRDYDRAIIVEGLADYLTALMLWPDAWVLGATDAGCYPLVARFAARTLASRGGGDVVLVAQRDFVGTDDEYKAKTEVGKANRSGAADRSVDEASKNVMSILGTRGVAWVECAPHKDLNDRFRAGVAIDVIRPLEEDFGSAVP